MSELLSDLKFTQRLAANNRAFTAIAILSLALGIGASSAIFSLIYAVLLDPYPYKDADRIVATTFVDKSGQGGTIAYTVPDYLELKKSAHTIEDAFLFDNPMFVATRGLPEQVRGCAFSPNAFGFMGVAARLGRTFGPPDINNESAPPHIVVLSYLFWQHHFGSDPKVTGRTLELNHESYDIVGVLPPRFTWGDCDAYVPLPMLPDAKRPLSTMLRIQRGASLSSVNSELQMLTGRFVSRSPTAYPKDFKLAVKTLNNWLLGKFRGTLVILMAAVGCLLLIACGNVSILLLARANVRRKEVAIRVALGARRRRLVRQFLTESVVLSIFGGILGVVVAYRGVPAIVALMPEYAVPHEAVIQVNGMVVLFTFLISVATGLLFGMAPALQLAKSDVRGAMLESGRSFTGSLETGKARSFLIVAEVALTVVLLVGAGVALRSFIALTRTPLGYDPTNVMTLFIGTREGAYKTWDTRRVFFQRILDALQSIPGVDKTAVDMTGVPPQIGFESSFEITGKTATAQSKTLVALIGGDYFAALHIPLLHGHLFTGAELQRSAHIAIINSEMQKKFFSDGRDPVGMTIRIPEMKFQDNPWVLTQSGFDPTFQIIGVVSTARNQGLHDDAKPAVYVPYTFTMANTCEYLVRTFSDPHKFEKAFREQVRTVDADQPVIDMRTLDEVLSRQERAYPRFSSTLFTIFAAVALLLAATGIYSVVSFVVAQRTHEFGIRMALGARSHDILRLVAGMTARLIVTGTVIGLAGAFALSRMIAEYVHGWNPKDPVAFIAVTVVMLTVGLISCWVPARRAAAVQPMASLRHD